MGYVGSYLWQLRQVVGSRLLLVPGSQVLVLDDDDRALFQQRTDDRCWALPAGGCEPGDDFKDTAVKELHEESGLVVARDDLIAFGCLSDPDVHTLKYPNGDLVHAFSMCFVTRTWTGTLTADPDEVLDHQFAAMTSPPGPTHPPALAVLEMYDEFASTGTFQAR